MLDSARALTPEGRRLAIEISQNMERESNERDQREQTELRLNLENQDRMVIVLTEENLMLSENNRMLRETVAARDKEIKRLHDDLKVYRSASASEASAAKRPRTESPDGSGAKP
jgi:hypothetical protein